MGTHRHKTAKIEVARRWYIDGMPIEEIARKMGHTDSTIYNWKRRDAEAGFVWEEMRIESEVSPQKFSERQRLFLSSLFDDYLNGRNEIKSIEKLDDRLTMLERYATSYYKLVHGAKQNQPQIEVGHIITKIISTIVTIADESGNETIKEWLLENLDTIKLRAVREVG